MTENVVFSGRCKNARCLELLEADDRVTLPWIGALGFCPSCRAAMAIGFGHGASACALLSAIVGALVALWRYFA